MHHARKLSAICMSAALTSLIVIAILCDLSPALKCFAIFSAVTGYFELYKWFQK